MVAMQNRIDTSSQAPGLASQFPGLLAARCNVICLLLAVGKAQNVFTSQCIQHQG